MALTAQEADAIDRILPILDELWGPAWQAPDGSTLDEEESTERTPECIITNGNLKAAIEVKRLVGDSGWVTYFRSKRSLERRLSRQVVGSYYLVPPRGLHFPYPESLMKGLAKEMNRLAPRTAVGDITGVRVQPRVAHLSLISEDRPGGYIQCNHASLIRDELAPRLRGWFWMDDGDSPEHSFVTDECREDFCLAVVAASKGLLTGGDGRITWTEEWELHRTDDNDDGLPHVSLVVGVVGDVPSGIREVVSKMVAQALAKFWQKWADKHVIVFDDKYMDLCEPQYVRPILADLAPSLETVVDLIVLIHKEQAIQVWP